MIAALLVVIAASGLANTPYSLQDGYQLCARHQHTGPINDEGWRVQGVIWDSGFEYCHDLMAWWAEAKPAQDANDKRMLEEMRRALGPYPWPEHVK